MEKNINIFFDNNGKELQEIIDNILIKIYKQNTTNIGE